VPRRQTSRLKLAFVRGAAPKDVPDPARARFNVVRFCFVVVASLAAGCGSSFSSADDAGAPDDAAADAASDATQGDSGPSSDAAADAESGDCPDEGGKYAVLATGAGCGNLASSGVGCITQSVCAITLAPSGAVNSTDLMGTANVQVDGSFQNATFMEGTSSRTGCVGTWDPTTSKLTIDCGGMGTAQSCSAVLTRTAMTCN
jgi:hypothetical protein